jgi:hypothetical protein
MKTPEEINAANAEFWKAENERFRRLVETYPHDLTKAAELATTLVNKGLGNDPDLLAKTSLNAAMHEAEWLRQQDQSIRGQKDRPGAKSQIRKQIIVAMRQFCIGNEDRTLNDFIEAAQARSIEGLMMEPPYTFVLIHDEGEASKAYKFRGLRNLWTEARKNALR